MPKAQDTVDYGYQKVSADEKTARVRGVFDAVASRYDLMNDLMSGGLHRVWKREYVKRIPLTNGMKILDLAGGTGDIAFKLLERARAEGKEIHITVSDINEEMLEHGKARAIDKGLITGLEWEVINAEKISHKAKSFDVITMAYGIRNVTHKDKALREMQRVLKPGGMLTILEFAPVKLPILKELYDLYSFHIIPQVGQVVTGDRAAYEYFVESIRMFPEPPVFKGMIEQAGLTDVRYKPLTLGVTNIHTGWKHAA